MKEHGREVIVCTYCGGIGKYLAQVMFSGESDKLTECPECKGTGLQFKKCFIEPYDPEKADIWTKLFDT